MSSSSFSEFSNSIPASFSSRGFSGEISEISLALQSLPLHTILHVNPTTCSLGAVECESGLDQLRQRKSELMSGLHH